MRLVATFVHTSISIVVIEGARTGLSWRLWPYLPLHILALEALPSSRIDDALDVRGVAVCRISRLHRVIVCLSAVPTVLNGLQLGPVVHSLDLDRRRYRDLRHLRVSL